MIGAKRQNDKHLEGAPPTRETTTPPISNRNKPISNRNNDAFKKPRK